MGIIYRFINKVNGKGYTGLTTRDFETRKSEHFKNAKAKVDEYWFHQAIRKYGEENFDYYIIGEYEEQYLSYMEIYWIYYNGDYGYGYNMTPGGSGNSMHCLEETKKILSEINEPNARACICLELNKIFPSLLEAQRQTNISAGNISHACCGDYITAGGYHWCWANESKTIEEIENNRKLFSRGKQILCVTDNKIYPSILQASVFYNISHPAIRKSIKNGKPTKGLLFKLI